MSKVLVPIGTLFASLVVAACVSDSSGSAPGTLDGPCLSNGMCNAGLSCDVVDGVAKCAPVTDADTGDSSSGNDGSTEAGLPVCKFAPTPWPSQCPGGELGASCFGGTQWCSGTGCGTAERWQCFGPNQCSNAPCCVSASVGALTPGQNCSQGALTISSGTMGGAVCGAGAACAADDAGPQTQLCQFNYQCPAGQICSAVKVVAPDAATIDTSILGVCVPF
jgi:hypothetical protein